LTASWPALPYEEWRSTCDTVHAHTQVLGKLAVALAPPEPQLEHAALRLSARGWETAPLPAPNQSGALVAGLDLQTHEAFVEHSDGRTARAPLTPNRPVGDVTKQMLAEIHKLAGAFHFNPTPQEVSWTVPLDEDTEHFTYDPAQVATYFSAATRANLVLGAIRAPYRGRVSPLNAWWGTFDLAVSLFSGRPAEPPSGDFIMRNAGDAEQIELGWWPGDDRYPKAAFYAFAMPAPENFAGATVSPPAARWHDTLGEYVLDWDDVISDPDPHGAAVEFGRSVVTHACAVCGWDPELAGSALGNPPPVH
jgi:hypothetical protein